MHGTIQRIALRWFSALLGLGSLAVADFAMAQAPERANVEGQPLAANVERVVRALDVAGTPLPGELTAALAKAGAARDAIAQQELLDPHVLLVVTINPRSASRSGAVRTRRCFSEGLHPGPGQGDQRSGDHEGPPHHQPPVRAVTAGTADLSMRRQDQRHLKEGEVPGALRDDSSSWRWSRASL